MVRYQRLRPSVPQLFYFFISSYPKLNHSMHVTTFRTASFIQDDPIFNTKPNRNENGDHYPQINSYYTFRQTRLMETRAPQWHEKHAWLARQCFSVGIYQRFQKCRNSIHPISLSSTYITSCSSREKSARPLPSSQSRPKCLSSHKVLFFKAGKEEVEKDKEGLAKLFNN